MRNSAKKILVKGAFLQSLILSVKTAIKQFGQYLKERNYCDGDVIMRNEVIEVKLDLKNLIPDFKQIIKKSHLVKDKTETYYDITQVVNDLNELFFRKIGPEMTGILVFKIGKNIVLNIGADCHGDAERILRTIDDCFFGYNKEEQYFSETEQEIWLIFPNIFPAALIDGMASSVLGMLGYVLNKKIKLQEVISNEQIKYLYKKS